MYGYTKPKKATLKSVSPKSSAAALKWKKVKCDGYEIQYADNKAMKKAKTLKINKKDVAKTVKKLKRGKTFYFRIRAYKKYKTASGRSKTVFGKWSAKKSSKIK